MPRYIRPTPKYDRYRDVNKYVPAAATATATTQHGATCTQNMYADAMDVHPHNPHSSLSAAATATATALAAAAATASECYAPSMLRPAVAIPPESPGQHHLMSSPSQQHQHAPHAMTQHVHPLHQYVPGTQATQHGATGTIADLGLDLDVCANTIANANIDHDDTTCHADRVRDRGVNSDSKVVHRPNSTPMITAAGPPLKLTMSLSAPMSTYVLHPPWLTGMQQRDNGSGSGCRGNEFDFDLDSDSGRDGGTDYGQVLDVLLADSLLVAVRQGMVAVYCVNVDVDVGNDGTSDEKSEKKKKKKTVGPTLLCCWPAPSRTRIACAALTPDARVLACVVVQDDADGDGYGVGDDRGTSTSAAVVLLKPKTGQRLLRMSLPASFACGSSDISRKRTETNGIGTGTTSSGGELVNNGEVEVESKDENRNVNGDMGVALGNVLAHNKASTPASTAATAGTVTGTLTAGADATTSTTPLTTPSLSPAANYHQQHQPQQLQEHQVRQQRQHEVQPNTIKGDCQVEAECVNAHHQLESGLSTGKPATNRHLETISASAATATVGGGDGVATGPTSTAFEKKQKRIFCCRMSERICDGISTKSPPQMTFVSVSNARQPPSDKGVPEPPPRGVPKRLRTAYARLCADVGDASRRQECDADGRAGTLGKENKFSVDVETEADTDADLAPWSLVICDGGYLVQNRRRGRSNSKRQGGWVRGRRRRHRRLGGREGVEQHEARDRCPVGDEDDADADRLCNYNCSYKDCTRCMKSSDIKRAKRQQRRHVMSVTFRRGYRRVDRVAYLNHPLMRSTVEDNTDPDAMASDSGADSDAGSDDDDDEESGTDGDGDEDEDRDTDADMVCGRLCTLSRLDVLPSVCSDTGAGTGDNTDMGPGAVAKPKLQRQRPSNLHQNGRQWDSDNYTELNAAIHTTRQIHQLARVQQSRNNGSHNEGATTDGERQKKQTGSKEGSSRGAIVQFEQTVGDAYVRLHRVIGVVGDKMLVTCVTRGGLLGVAVASESALCMAVGRGGVRADDVRAVNVVRVPRGLGKDKDGDKTTAVAAVDRHGVPRLVASVDVDVDDTRKSNSTVGVGATAATAGGVRVVMMKDEAGARQQGDRAGRKRAGDGGGSGTKRRKQASGEDGVWVDAGAVGVAGPAGRCVMAACARRDGRVVVRVAAIKYG